MLLLDAELMLVDVCAARCHMLLLDAELMLVDVLAARCHMLLLDAELTFFPLIRPLSACLSVLFKAAK